MVSHRRKQSVTGRFVSGEDHWKYLQDGPKEEMLCYSCEQRLQKFEDFTAREVWYPLHNSPEDQVTYGREFYRMCVAVCWRAVEFCRIQQSIGSEWERPSEIWRAYLNNERADCDGLNQHVIIFPEYTSESSLPPNIPRRLNQYLRQGFGLHLWKYGGIPVVMVKSGNFVILGIGAIDTSVRPWADHLVHSCGGQVGVDQTITLPEEIWSSLAKAANNFADFADGRTQKERDRARQRGEIRNPDACSDSDRLKSIDDRLTQRGIKD